MLAGNGIEKVCATCPGLQEQNSAIKYERDTLKLQKTQLEVENAQIRQQFVTENARLKKQLEGEKARLIEKLEGENARLKERLESEYTQLHMNILQLECTLIN